MSIGESIPESIAFQTDVFGQVANDQFLADEADDLLSSGSKWYDMVQTAVDTDDWESIDWIRGDIETALNNAGYTVIWDNGVFIYRSADIPDDFDWMGI